MAKTITEAQLKAEANFKPEMFPETAIDAKAYMEDFFNIDLTI